MINGNKAIGVPVKSETRIELFLKDFLLQKFRIYRTTLFINIASIWHSMPDTHHGTKLSKQGRSGYRGCPIRTIQTDAKLDRSLRMKSLPEKTNIVLYTTLIKTWTSNSFPRERLLRLHATYPGFHSLLKPILQLCPCSGEKLDPIIHVGIMRC